MDAAARARRRPSGSPSSAGSRPGCRAWCRPSAASAARSCARSTASTPAPGSPTSTRSPTSTSPTTCSSRLAPAAVRRIREHRAAGHRTVLITGAIRPLTRPLLPLFDHIEAAELAVDDRGVCTGHLAASPLVGESRAAWMRALRRRARHRPDDVLRLRRLPLRPAAARGRRQPGGGAARRTAVPPRPAARAGTIVDWASPDAAARTLNPAGVTRR